MTDPVEDAARSAAVILAPELGANLPAEVEAAQPGWVTSAHTRKGPRRPTGCVSVSVSHPSGTVHQRPLQQCSGRSRTVADAGERRPAFLESVLEATPQEFESPILRCLDLQEHR